MTHGMRIDRYRKYILYYGSDECLEAFRLNIEEGEGPSMIGFGIDPSLGHRGYEILGNWLIDAGAWLTTGECHCPKEE